MADERAERLALNEALFRTANERMGAWEERHEDSAPEEYHCECASLECRERISLSHADYERIRADSSHFFVVPDHQTPDVEQVIERQDGWLVIEKLADVAPLVEATNPRTP